jgi:hypothetical protein
MSKFKQMEKSGKTQVKVKETPAPVTNVQIKNTQEETSKNSK